MGKAIAEALGEYGATVIISSNDLGGCKKVASDLNQKGIIAYDIPCDVSSKEEIDQLVVKALQKADKIDILVSCVGIAPAGSFLGIHSEQFERTMQLNLQSGIYLTKTSLWMVGQLSVMETESN